MLVLQKEGTATFSEKKSRFIGYAKPVSSEEEALGYIAAIKKRHWDATHNVYAYQIGGRQEKEKSSDDGEPSGTAGRPVLEVIKKRNLRNTVVVVTRYFGGVLLGAGGLVRAYTKAAQAAIGEAGTVEMKPGQRFCLVMEYTLLGKVQNDLALRSIQIEKTVYQNNAALYCLVLAEEAEVFTAFITEAYGGRVALTVLDGQVWITANDLRTS